LMTLLLQLPAMHGPAGDDETKRQWERQWERQSPANICIHSL